MEKLLVPFTTQSPGKARGTVPAQLTAVSWQLKAGLGSRNKAVSSRLAVVVPRIILV